VSKRTQTSWNGFRVTYTVMDCPRYVYAPCSMYNVTATAILVLKFFLWPLYGIGQAIIFLPWFLLLSLFYFSSPNLSHLRLDVYHTSTRGVALVQILDAGLKRGQPLGLEPSTLYSIHFFTQSVSSFHSTCPYHCNLFCCSINIISSIPSLSLNSLLGTLSFVLTLHIHLTILISAR